MERYNEYGETISHYMASVVDALNSRGGVLETDWVHLDTMAWNYWLWTECKKAVMKDGIMIVGSTMNMVKNPAIDAANAAIRQANSIAEAYGLTPMSRKKLTKEQKKATKEQKKLTREKKNTNLDLEQ